MGSWSQGKGIVLQGAGKPIVLCSVDWIGISNDSQDAFRQALAVAAEQYPNGSLFIQFISMMLLSAILVLNVF